MHSILPEQPITSSLSSLQSPIPLHSKDGGKHLPSAHENMLLEQIAPIFENKN